MEKGYIILGKIYCITGESIERFDDVKKALLKWSEAEQTITFSEKSEDNEYNLYLNDYLVAADINEYEKMVDKYGDERISPIYLCVHDEIGNIPMNKEFFKLYDISDFKNCMKDIVETEFSDYKESKYQFMVLEEEIEEEVQQEILQNQDAVEAVQQKKKTAFIIISSILCLSVTLMSVLAIFGINRSYSFLDNNFVVLPILGIGEVRTLVVGSDGNVYTFEGYNFENVEKSMEGNHAIVRTDYDDLFLIGRGEAIKLAENVRMATISQNGNYVYYMAVDDESDDKYIICRYDVINRETIDLDSFDIIPDENYYMVTSPNGKYLAFGIETLG